MYARVMLDGARAAGRLPSRIGPAPSAEQLWRLAPHGVGLAAFGLGLVRLTSQPRSYDEKVTIATASRPVGGIWRAARATEAPHLVYYLLMKVWLDAFGTGDWVARFPSVLFGALAALTLTVVGTRLFGRVAGLVAGVTLATAAFALHFSQWARPYALALFLTVLATYGFVRALEDPRGRWIALWAVSTVAACWVNLFAISALAVQIAAYLVVRPKPRPRLALWSGVGVLAAVTPIVVLVGSADNGQLGWIPTPTPRRVAVESWDWSSRNPAVLAAALVGLWVLVVAGRRRGAAWKSTLVVGLTIVPFAVLLLLSAVQPAFDSHYLLTAVAGLALLVGAGVAALRPRPALLLAALVAAGSGLQLAHYYVAPGQPFSAMF
jgi:mannosyltransferase